VFHFTLYCMVSFLIFQNHKKKNGSKKLGNEASDRFQATFKNCVFFYFIKSTVTVEPSWNTTVKKVIILLQKYKKQYENIIIFDPQRTTPPLFLRTSSCIKTIDQASSTTDPPPLCQKKAKYSPSGAVSLSLLPGDRPRSARSHLCEVSTDFEILAENQEYHCLKSSTAGEPNF